MEGRDGLPIDKSFPTSALESVKYINFVDFEANCN